ncbi:MAG: type 1 glutamine amidotransferase [Nanoarchaeota archaeon]|nr:type 1 glutamine amidotransferase [Nanoarchaeota archaeon]
MKDKKVLIVKNVPREGPGLLRQVLKEKNINFDIVDLDKGEKFPETRSCPAVFVFGGSDSANDQTPKMKDELKRIKETVDAGVPYFGVCLGMQTLVKANGGEVYKNPIKEIGFTDPNGNYFEIELTKEGKKDPIFDGIPSPFKIFHLHGETVRLSNGMTLLATGKYCTNQVVKVGKNAYGFQGHLELNNTMLKTWIAKDSDLKSTDPAALMAEYKTLEQDYQNNGRTILTNFLQIAGLI